ncbi:MAG: SMP-30/gluconolactonase/LRE family protein [Rhodospirillaceae bacterium]|nr:SMP-30/gluconolactonase/LRE family protein [Rhodospirillaceae bacterium]MBT4427483.1 SMP-30/gluconolactonase/LRE family protein [Rhodospirillaceae bacterium]MBT5040408.1 SMP-30/gluconolactonase/LRE family protein [Rhodospirillaceae bacterium]MBT5674120.1 SMP-30/gluconolactonase/LRE family protein [Rhodospirillaceae bacterium]MBT5781126.1 SMP-30/gluconolactonase/LRE family protein [Rhodospirillaceae bacterium]
MVKIECVVDEGIYLGEGPVWDVEDGLLYWVDIKGPHIWSYEPKSKKTNRWIFPKDITSIFRRKQGSAVVTLQDGFYFYDLDSGALELIALVDADEPLTRLNDAKVDRRGRLIAGGEEEKEEQPLSGLWRLDPDLSVHTLEMGIICNNGPCWSPDDKTFYHADTFMQSIYAYDYDIESGSIANKRVFASTEDEPGLADGSTVDEEGYLWNAQVISGQLVRYAPDGSIERRIPMPVSNITSVMFGGDDLDTLYVTSMARVDHPGGQGMFAEEEKPQPQAGGLFAVTGLGVRGLPESRFAG